MKRFLTVIVCFAMLLSLTACGGKTGSADVNKLVIWHDKEDAVITALSDYLAQAVPELDIQFEKKTSLTDSLKLVGNDPFCRNGDSGAGGAAAGRRDAG